MGKINTIKQFVSAILFLFVFFAFGVEGVFAQTTTLSIAPAIYEVTTKPGESIDITYVLANDSQANTLKATIFPFIPGDDNGGVELKKDLSVYDPLNQLAWFTFVKPKLELNQEFPMQSGEKKEIVLNLQVPKNAVGGDYYFTLLFETKEKGSNTPDSSTFSQARIGTNLLIYIDDGRLVDKKARIENFSAPLLIDSFSDLNFKVVIANIGNTFFKPIGEIMITPLFGRSKNISLAPQNILTDSLRKINCLDGEKIVPCGRERGFVLGVYTAKLYFSPDGSSTKYSQERTVIAFPFILLSTILIVYLVAKLLRKKGKKKFKDN